MGVTKETKKFLELLRYMGEKNIGKRGKPPHIDTFGDLYLEDMFTKAADMIESLSATCDRLTDALETCGFENIEAVFAELDQVKRERDAAVEALRDTACCADCKNYATKMDSEPCKTCLMCPSQSKPNWQWRWVREAEG